MKSFMPWYEQNCKGKAASQWNTKEHEWLYFLNLWKENYPMYGYLGIYLVMNLCLFLVTLIQYRSFKMLDGYSTNVYYILARATGTFRICISYF